MNLGISTLDFKLGARMLVKYPGLTVIGGLTLAVAIGLGAGWFDVTRQLLDPRLPLDEGDRIVRVENWDTAASKLEQRSLYDFQLWREQLSTIRELGAYRSQQRNVITPDGSAHPALVAEITPSAFPLTRVPPALGRTLTNADAEPGAPDVAVIGYDIWQDRFNGDRGVVTRTILIGRIPTTIVGVMPEGFGFPVNHQLWVPLRAQHAGPRSGPTIQVFGRLADDATLESAQAEVATVGQRIATATPATHAQLRLRVLPWAAPEPDRPDVLLLNLSNIIAWLILAAACANVATLLFARTAAREAELVVRSALGASRWRVMMQLVIEALVLSAVAAIVGLTAVHFAIDDVLRLFVESEQNTRLPFWWRSGIGLETVAYAAALAVGGAVMVAVLPALKATGGRVQASLTSSGSSGTNMRFGGAWSFLIVLQVAMAALCLPLGVMAAFWTIRDQVVRSDFPTHEFLTVRPELDRDTMPETLTEEQFRGRSVTVYEELRRRLEADPSVAGVTFADVLPGLSGSLRQVEAQRGSETPFLVNANIEGDRVRTASVATGYFDAVSLPILAGRDFHGGDAAAQNAAVVNETLARNIGGSPVGVRIRYAARGNDEPASPWHEVVGVVRDTGLEAPAPDEIFLPTSVARMDPLYVTVHVKGGAAEFAPGLRQIAAQVEPGLRLYDLLSLDEVVRRRDRLEIQGMLAVLSVTALVMALSAAGLYALMSVAVTRRTREIGIRIALGAGPRGVIAAVFRRAAIQVGAGTAVASVLLPSFMTAIGISELPADFVIQVILITSGGMLLTAFLACLVPARRALRIQPAEAVKCSG